MIDTHVVEQRASTILMIFIYLNEQVSPDSFTLSFNLKQRKRFCFFQCKGAYTFVKFLVYCNVLKYWDT